MGLRSPVLIEEGWLLSHTAFGVGGTPSAILLDADLRVASGPARGVRAVTALMGIPHESWLAPRVPAFEAKAVDKLTDRTARITATGGINAGR
jgi:hypothetical protein